ncbi:MAG TPA: hypothetical protein VFL13_14010 [Candidatus Baltobacteraceae bacterium]|nr:hypothetical protein [Candidatus Baltobacteraceae bacterium]
MTLEPLLLWIAAGALSAALMLAVCFAGTRLVELYLKRASARVQAEEQSVVRFVARFLPQVLAIAVVPWIVGLAPKHSVQTTAFIFSYAAVVLCYFIGDRMYAKKPTAA